MRKTSLWILGLIVIVAAVLRLTRLSSVPPGVNRDEASIGVTAYSLMTTGKDEYGKTLPLSFQSFGDWKLPLYIYTDIPFVKLFGLSELAVRLPSALFGIASVAILYFLTYELFASESLALLSSLSLALMPWHIHISRVESEAITAVFFLILGSYLFLRAIRKKSLAPLLWSSVIFGLTYYTYHGNHISTSLLLLGLFLIYRKDILRVKKWWIALGIGSVLVGAILAVTLSADHTKISGISIFGDPTVVHEQIELPRMSHARPDSLMARLVHNRITYAVQTVFDNYLKSYGPTFLFIRGGGNSAHNIRGYGNLHPIEAPVLLLGIAWLIAASKKKSSRFTLWWILLGGIAAAITKDAPHSNRMLAVVPSFAIAVALGIQSVRSYVSPKTATVFFIVIALGYSAGMGYYLDRYYDHFPKEEAANWGYAYKKLVPVLDSPQNSGKQVIMTRPETSPYIYLLFYGGYPPARYQTETSRYPISPDGFLDVKGFGRYSFRPIVWETDITRPDTLLIARPEEVPDSYLRYLSRTVTLPDGTPYFLVLATDSQQP